MQNWRSAEGRSARGEKDCVSRHETHRRGQRCRLDYGATEEIRSCLESGGARSDEPLVMSGERTERAHRGSRGCWFHAVVSAIAAAACRHRHRRHRGRDGRQHGPADGKQTDCCSHPHGTLDCTRLPGVTARRGALRKLRRRVTQCTACESNMGEKIPSRAREKNPAPVARH